MAQNALELYKRIKNDPDLQSQTYSLDDAGNLYDASGNRMGGQPQPQEQGFNRANFLPLVEYPDGRVEFGLPNILAAPLEGLQNFGRYGYDTPEAISDNARSAFDVAGSMATGSLAATPLKPSNALGAMGGGMAKDLPMDLASRMARAKEMGFDVDRPLYHGASGQDFNEFKPSRMGEFGPGSYFSTEPKEASSYAMSQHSGNNPRVIPVYTNANLLKVTSPDEFWTTFLKPGMTDNQAIQSAIDAGFEGVEFTRPLSYWDDAKKQIVDTSTTQTHINVFDPTHIRSVNAAFDPAKSNSANLMAVNPYTSAIIPFAVNALENR